MAFPSSPGYGNLPRGNWSPVAYSKKVLNFFRTVSVVEAITNTDYEGDIKDQGDTVRIIKEPLITVRDYARGKELVSQDIDDEDFTLVVDQAKYYQFRIDDIERKMSHIDWSSKALSSAGYALANEYDQNILQYMHDNSSDGVGTGVTGTPVAIGYTAGSAFTPLDLINRFCRILDENDVPMEGRFFVAPPAFYELLAKEDSKLIEVSVTGDPESVIRNRKFATSREIHTFTCFKSNNMPLSANGDVVVMAGHMSSTATANALTKSEVIRSENTFADIYRGLKVYGRKVLRPEALFSGYISF